MNNIDKKNHLFALNEQYNSFIASLLSFLNFNAW